MFSVKRLKPLRIAVSGFFIVAITAVFLDPVSVIPPGVAKAIGVVQFIPALLRLFGAFSILWLGFAFVVFLTLLFGRVYCSSLCPLGTLQDIVFWFAKKRNRKKRHSYKYKKPWYAVHYTLTAAGLALALGGSMLLFNLLEPFTNYGRVMNALFRPVVIGINNGATFLLERAGIFAMYHIPVHFAGVAAFSVSVLFLAVVAVLAYRSGRLFCNLLCPAGALLGILSRVSLFKLSIDHDACNDCGLCERVCRAQCIDSDTKRIDYAACVNCYDCISACSTTSIKHTWQLKKQNAASEPVPVDAGRRNVLRTGIATAGLTAASSIAAVSDAKPRRVIEPITPPGSVSRAHFTSLCTACHLCVSSCPTQVLHPTLLEYGMAGMLQPRMDYSLSYCNYDCVQCGIVCPTGAIVPMVLPEKKLAQLGKAKFEKELCIVVSKKKDCAACSEHCPTKAVTTIPYETRFLPQVAEDLCIGCGACEHACPVTPEKAIYIVANAVHERAKPPLKKVAQPEAQPKPATPEEFPF